MKTILVAIFCMTLSGCFYQQVDTVEIERANTYCKSENSEIYRLASHSIGFVTVECKNGKKGKVS